MLALIWPCAAADNFTPEVKKVEHDDLLSWYYYFDDSSTVLATKSESVEISFDDGATWTTVPEMANYEVIAIKVDPYVKERAFAIAKGSTHFVTNDSGKTWSKFELKGSKVDDFYDMLDFKFNIEKPDLVLVEATNCRGPAFMRMCSLVHFYTTDGFKSNPKKLTEYADSCTFAFSNRDFSSDIAKETILCAHNVKNSFGHITKSELLISSDFFKTQQVVGHDILKSGKIINVRVDSAFILVLVQKDKFALESEVTMLVSKDGKLFEASDLDVLMEYGAVLFLESSPLSIFLSVVRPKKFSQGELTMYASDSSGLKFSVVLEHVQPSSIVKSQYVDGVWIANVLGDSEGLVSTPFGKETIYFTSKISIDDGKSWDPLEITDDPKCKISDGCSLQTFLIGDIPNNEKFVTGPTPNILMAMGSTGKGRLYHDDMATFLSRDGGLTWKKIISETTIYTFADQGNIIVAVPVSVFKETPTAQDTLYFSLDQGESFDTLKLETPIVTELLITTLDGTSTKVIVFGITEKNKAISYTLDFDKAFGGATCKEADFEKVMARDSPKLSGPVCVRGHKESFNRRKQDAKCLVKTLFEDVKVQEDPCDCTASDFECAAYFTLSDKNACVPNLQKIEELCKLQKKRKIKLPHQRLKAGNLCKLEKKKESDFVSETEFDCNNLDVPTEDETKGKIGSYKTEISGMLLQYSYISSGKDYSDNILVNTDQHYAYASNDGGKSFVKIPIGERIAYFAVGAAPGVVVLCSEENIFYSNDGGNFFTKYKAPGRPPTYGNAITFHPKQPEKFIYYTGDGCGSISGSGCKLYYTTDGGELFKLMLEDTGRCEYVSETLELEDEMIMCAALSGSKRKLVSSIDYFKESTTLIESIVDFALRTKFVFVASIADDGRELRAKVTSDGKTFADADFPSDFKVEIQSGYTLLESGTRSIFLHVTTNRSPGQEIGTILKSNSNGTFYVSVLPDVSRNELGFTDFDRIDILEGVLLANVVANPNSKEPKKLQTRITFNEGSEWHFLAPPAVGVDGKKYPCIGSPLSKCALHLQGFTERPDYRDTFSSSSAIGFLIGVGNVGEYLGSSELATFLSADGGVTWREIRKGSYMWEYGDKGTILLLVDAVNPTNEVVYSTDGGKTWNVYEFTDKPVQVWDLATVPTDTARRFVIFGGEDGKLKSNTQIFGIDFTHFYSRQCQLDLDNPLNDDFDYWTPRHPEAADNCLFGRETKYLRRAEGHNDCFIGASPLEEGVKVVRNCTCTRRDYECDYNYYADNDGTCKLVSGLSPQDRRTQMCSKNGTFQYFEPTGYRKIPSSTCIGGKSFDSLDPHACPGHEKEFNEFYGINMSWGKWLVVVLVPVGVFVFVVWFVYEKGIRRNGGFQRFGQIRLDDDDLFLPIEENSVDVVVNRIVRGGIIVVAGTIAVVKTLRKVDRKFMEEVTRVIFGRRPGRRNYVRVPDDEDELFGNFEDNYEEDMEDGAAFDFDVQLDPEIFEDFSEEDANADSRLFDIADEDGRSDDVASK